MFWEVTRDAFCVKLPQTQWGKAEFRHFTAGYRPLREDEVLPVRTHRMVDTAPSAADEWTETSDKKKRHRKDRLKEKKKEKRDKKVSHSVHTSKALEILKLVSW